MKAAIYLGLLAAAFAAAVLVALNFGSGIDDYAYDLWFRLFPQAAWQPQSAILAIDDRTLDAYGGIHEIRKPLAEALALINSKNPKAVAVDIILATKNPAADDALAAAFRATPHLVLDSERLADGWEDPLPEFRARGTVLGHVSVVPDSDGITRSIPLVKLSGHDQRWAISLEAFRLSRGAEIVQSPDDLEVGATVIPAPQKVVDSANRDDSRFMRVRFAPFPIPQVGVKDLIDHPDKAAVFAGKVVFVGVTALTEVQDRLMTPVTQGPKETGIEIHADAFETMAQGLFLRDVPGGWVVLFSLGLVVATGLAFRYLPGWWAYAGGLAILALAHLAPYAFFTHRLVFPLALPAAAAWFSTLAAAGYYYLVVRRNWRVEQAARTRYQQAMQFVTHEMRTPLSAIQGSSELISRYALTEEKRKQIAQLINSESKRLARMVEVFLSVERLSVGQMELKRESIDVKRMMEICLERVGPLADRKHIAVALLPISDDLEITGDRELMEYACYNLLTNAVKYSPQRTEVTVSARKDDHHVRMAVQDQGIGMDQKEVKQIFKKFYRTKKAEESGEAGTGIGLSIVQQIVEQHGGQIEVTSRPGEGSCFTLVMPAAIRAQGDGQPEGAPHSSTLAERN
ncbi:MAG TPA: CHASE2 domain-containing protein [Bryobacteraceae bacterium]|nr:CHASE2 domain-containing protein [Bryobacteraceae bacterium]